VQNKLLVIAEGVGMVDIDQVFPSQDGYEPKGGDPLNQEGANHVIEELMAWGDQWSRDDLLRDGDFTKVMSFATREGIAVQLYLKDQRFVLVRFDMMNPATPSSQAQFTVVGQWATVHPRWLVLALANYGLHTWGV
jgi:hypothetical protein